MAPLLCCELTNYLLEKISIYTWWTTVTKNFILVQSWIWGLLCILIGCAQMSCSDTAKCSYFKMQNYSIWFFFHTWYCDYNGSIDSVQWGRFWIQRSPDTALLHGGKSEHPLQSEIFLQSQWSVRLCRGKKSFFNVVLLSSCYSCYNKLNYF